MIKVLTQQERSNGADLSIFNSLTTCSLGITFTYSFKWRP